MLIVCWSAAIAVNASSWSVLRPVPLLGVSSTVPVGSAPGSGPQHGARYPYEEAALPTAADISGPTASRVTPLELEADEGGTGQVQDSQARSGTPPLTSQEFDWGPPRPGPRAANVTALVTLPGSLETPQREKLSTNTESKENANNEGTLLQVKASAKQSTRNLQRNETTDRRSRGAEGEHVYVKPTPSPEESPYRNSVPLQAALSSSPSSSGSLGVPMEAVALLPPQHRQAFIDTARQLPPEMHGLLLAEIMRATSAPPYRSSAASSSPPEKRAHTGGPNVEEKRHGAMSPTDETQSAGAVARRDPLPRPPPSPQSSSPTPTPVARPTLSPGARSSTVSAVHRPSPTPYPPSASTPSTVSPGSPYLTTSQDHPLPASQPPSPSSSLYYYPPSAGTSVAPVREQALSASASHSPPLRPYSTSPLPDLYAPVTPSLYSPYSAQFPQSYPASHVQAGMPTAYGPSPYLGTATRPQPGPPTNADYSYLSGNPHFPPHYPPSLTGVSGPPPPPVPLNVFLAAAPPTPDVLAETVNTAVGSTINQATSLVDNTLRAAITGVVNPAAQHTASLLYGIQALNEKLYAGSEVATKALLDFAAYRRTHPTDTLAQFVNSLEEATDTLNHAAAAGTPRLKPTIEAAQKEGNPSVSKNGELLEGMGLFSPSPSGNPRASQEKKSSKTSSDTKQDLSAAVSDAGGKAVSGALDLPQEIIDLRSMLTKEQIDVMEALSDVLNLGFDSAVNFVKSQGRGVLGLRQFPFFQPLQRRVMEMYQRASMHRDADKQQLAAQEELEANRKAALQRRQREQQFLADMQRERVAMLQAQEQPAPQRQDQQEQPPQERPAAHHAGQQAPNAARQGHGQGEALQKQPRLQQAQLPQQPPQQPNSHQLIQQQALQQQLSQMQAAQQQRYFQEQFRAQQQHLARQSDPSRQQSEQKVEVLQQKDQGTEASPSQQQQAMNGQQKIAMDGQQQAARRQQKEQRLLLNDRQQHARALTPERGAVSPGTVHLLFARGPTAGFSPLEADTSPEAPAHDFRVQPEHTSNPDSSLETLFVGTARHLTKKEDRKKAHHARSSHHHATRESHGVRNTGVDLAPGDTARSIPDESSSKTDPGEAATIPKADSETGQSPTDKDNGEIHLGASNPVEARKDNEDAKEVTKSRKHGPDRKPKQHRRRDLAPSHLFRVPDGSEDRTTERTAGEQDPMRRVLGRHAEEEEESQRLAQGYEPKASAVGLGSEENVEQAKGTGSPEETAAQENTADTVDVTPSHVRRLATVSVPPSLSSLSPSVLSLPPAFALPSASSVSMMPTALEQLLSLLGVQENCIHENIRYKGLANVVDRRSSLSLCQAACRAAAAAAAAVDSEYQSAASRRLESKEPTNLQDGHGRTVQSQYVDDKSFTDEHLDSTDETSDDLNDTTADDFSRDATGPHRADTRSLGSDGTRKLVSRQAVAPCAFISYLPAVGLCYRYATIEGLVSAPGYVSAPITCSIVEHNPGPSQGDSRTQLQGQQHVGSGSPVEALHPERKDTAQPAAGQSGTLPTQPLPSSRAESPGSGTQFDTTGRAEPRTVASGGHESQVVVQSGRPKDVRQGGPNASQESGAFGPSAVASGAGGATGATAAVSGAEAATFAAESNAAAMVTPDASSATHYYSPSLAMHQKNLEGAYSPASSQKAVPQPSGLGSTPASSVTSGPAQPASMGMPQPPEIPSFQTVSPVPTAPSGFLAANYAPPAASYAPPAGSYAPSAGSYAPPPAAMQGPAAGTVVNSAGGRLYGQQVYASSAPVGAMTSGYAMPAAQTSLVGAQAPAGFLPATVPPAAAIPSAPQLTAFSALAPLPTITTPVATTAGSLLQTTQGLMQAGNALMQAFPLQQLLDAGQQLYASGFFRNRGMKHLQLPILGQQKQELPPPPGMEKPTVNCASEGMTCCVPENAADKWKERP